MARIENQTAPLDTYGASPQLISFFMVGNGTSAPTVATVGGAPLVASSTRSDVGINVVVLNVPVNQVVAHTAVVDDDAPDGSTATIGTITSEGTATPLSFTVYTYTSGSLADMGVGRKIRVNLRVRKSAWGNML
jgi:hypothetical protein